MPWRFQASELSVQKVRVAIRVDATANIGTGHFMRCLTLADELKKQGGQIRFVSRNLPLHLRNLLKAKEMEFVALSNEISHESTDELAHSAWLGTSQLHDAKETLLAISDHSWDWMVVDHYALDVRWESAVRKHAKQIMAIDDIADRQHDCDILLDQNYYADMETRYIGKVPTYCRLLLGPSYALLRDEFRKLREQIKPRTGASRRILLFFGGVDGDNYTGLAIKALAGVTNQSVHVDVVIGAQHPYREQIQQMCAMQGYACHIQTTRMAQLMAEADLAIGAGGSASWERCCLGLPALLVALAENQVDIAKALNSIGACVYIGTKDEADLLTLQQAITKLLETQDRRGEISQRAFSLVDGVGVFRVCQELGC